MCRTSLTSGCKNIYGLVADRLPKDRKITNLIKVIAGIALLAGIMSIGRGSSTFVVHSVKNKLFLGVTGSLLTITAITAMTASSVRWKHNRLKAKIKEKCVDTVAKSCGTGLKKSMLESLRDVWEGKVSEDLWLFYEGILAKAEMNELSLDFPKNPGSNGRDHLDALGISVVENNKSPCIEFSTHRISNPEVSSTSSSPSPPLQSINSERPLFLRIDLDQLECIFFQTTDKNECSYTRSISLAHFFGI